MLAVSSPVIDSHDTMPAPERLSFKRSADVEDLVNDGTGKRTRINSDNSSDEVHHGPTDIALLYNFAYSAWQASTRHLTQAFIPPSVGHGPPTDLPPIRLQDPLQPHRLIEYQPDPIAAVCATELCLTALNALATLLMLPNVSDKERVTAGLLFGKIGFQALQAQHIAIRLPDGIKIDCKRLLTDVQAQLAVCVSSHRMICLTSPAEDTARHCPQDTISHSSQSRARSPHGQGLAARGRW